MQIGKKGFPYPVLNNATNYNCYKNSTYELKYQLEEDAANFILRDVRIETNSYDLKNMIENNLAKVMIVIESSSTIYKHSQEIFLNPIDIVIPIGNLCGKVEISSIVYATKNINNYISEDFNDDFSGYSFNIEKYCPIAIDDGFISKIEYDDFNDKKVSSIFSVVKSYNEELNYMKVFNDDKKIKIELPEKEFQKFDSLNGEEMFSNVFFSIIIIPALSNCLKELQSEVKYDGKTIEDIIDSHTWFLSIQNAYKKLNNSDLTDDDFINLDTLEFSQLVMDSCSISSIDDFFDIITRKNDVQEEEII